MTRARGRRGKRNARFPLLPPALGNLANSARFPHSHSGSGRAWKRGKPESGFPLSHAGPATTIAIYKYKDLKYRNMSRGLPDGEEIGCLTAALSARFSGSSCVGIKTPFQDHPWIGKCWEREAAARQEVDSRYLTKMDDRNVWHVFHSSMRHQERRSKRTSVVCLNCCASPGCLRMIRPNPGESGQARSSADRQSSCRGCQMSASANAVAAPRINRLSPSACMSTG